MFSNILKSENIKTLIDDTSQKIETREPSESVMEFTNNIKEIALVSNIKTKKAHFKNRQHAPWFDDECKRQKNIILGLGRLLKRSNSDVKIRENLFFEKRKFNKLARKKKFDYNIYH